MARGTASGTNKTLFWFRRAGLKSAGRCTSVFSGAGCRCLLRWRVSNKLRGPLDADLTNAFLEVLLGGMEVSFYLLADYRRNIAGFQGSYVFCTKDNRVAQSVLFSDGSMTLFPNEQLNRYDVRVVFKDAAALRSFLLSRDQDILQSVLNNDVSVEGNLTYIYRFGFLARELLPDLGVEAWQAPATPR
jgi:hypothetical protein